MHESKRRVQAAQTSLGENTDKVPIAKGYKYRTGASQHKAISRAEKVIAMHSGTLQQQGMHG